MTIDSDNISAPFLRTAEYTFGIDLIDKWLPIHYSSVLVQISLLSMSYVIVSNINQVLSGHHFHRHKRSVGN